MLDSRPPGHTMILLPGGRKRERERKRRRRLAGEAVQYKSLGVKEKTGRDMGEISLAAFLCRRQPLFSWSCYQSHLFASSSYKSLRMGCAGRVL